MLPTSTAWAKLSNELSHIGHPCLCVCVCVCVGCVCVCVCVLWEGIWLAPLCTCGSMWTHGRDQFSCYYSRASAHRLISLRLCGCQRATWTTSRTQPHPHPHQCWHAHTHFHSLTYCFVLMHALTLTHMHAYELVGSDNVWEFWL